MEGLFSLEMGQAAGDNTCCIPVNTTPFPAGGIPVFDDTFRHMCAIFSFGF
jgi:hypothetical protein